MSLEFSLLEPLLELSLHFGLQDLQFGLLFGFDFSFSLIDNSFDFGFIDPGNVVEGSVEVTIKIPHSITSHELLVRFWVLLRWVDHMNVVWIVSYRIWKEWKLCEFLSICEESWFCCLYCGTHDANEFNI